MNFLKSLAAATLLMVSLTASAKNSPLIVGGVEATKGEFPFIVSLQNKMYGHFCGGSLIKANWILTAAHCTKGVTIETAQIGLHEMSNTTNVETFKVIKVIAHPQYNEDNMDYDYALVQIDMPSRFAPIALNTAEIDIKAGSQIMTIAAGWGAMAETSQSVASKLQKVSVPLVDADTCTKAYSGFNAISDRMICSGYAQGGKDACQGDSGGPLVTQDATGFKLVGVTSWGKGCARPNAYGVYSKVNAGIAWIESETAK